MCDKRWLRTGLTLLVIIVLLVGLLQVLTTEQTNHELPASIQTANDQAGSLVMQKSNLYKQRDRVQQEYTKRIQGMGTATLLFTQPDAVFMDIVVPMMEKSGLVGMVAFGADCHPGTEGCITLEQWHQLKAAGWEICLMWDGKTRLTSWMDKVNQYMTEKGIAPTLSVYVPDGLLSQELLIQAREMNLKALVHHGEESEEQQAIRGNDVWTPTAIAWHLDNTSEKVDAIASSGGSIVLEVKNEILWEGGYRRLFQSMLEKLVIWQNEDQLRIATIDQAIAYRQGVLMGGMELEEEMRSHLEALDLQIEELDLQIDALYQPVKE